MRRPTVLKIMCALLTVMSAVSFAYAATSTTINVTAEIAPLAGLNITISKITGTTWTPVGATMMDFGTLSYDSLLGIFKAESYFAVDIGILNNLGLWSLQHTPSTIYNTTTGNTSQKLDNNINVSFINQINSSSSTEIAKVSFANSTMTLTNAHITPGGWVRIYYGIGTGSGDNAGVTPIPSTQVAGTYQGTVTLTITP